MLEHMNRLSIDRQAQIAALLVEGVANRRAGRILDIPLNTVLRNGLWIGEACQRFHDAKVQGLKTTIVEADEMWTFLHTKRGHLPEELKDEPELGDTWTWIAVDPVHRIIINWHLGKRGSNDVSLFIDDLARRVPGTIQITTDQLPLYRAAIDRAFGNRVHYATIHKEMYSPTRTPDGRFNPTTLKKNEITTVFGAPDPEHITTTSIESCNARVRAWNSRYVRNTLAFSKRLRNLKASFALHCTYSNWCRINPAIRCTPAMEIGLTDHVWEIEELIEQINVEEGRAVRYLNAIPAPSVEEEDVPYTF